MNTSSIRPSFQALQKENAESTGNYVKDLSSMMRSKLKEIELLARDIVDYIKVNGGTTDMSEMGDKGECIGQAMLAMRHIEDARMRYGKVIQYTGDGVSNFDK